MKGYYTYYGYIGIMPDGTKKLFSTEKEYHEAWDRWFAIETDEYMEN